MAIGKARSGYHQGKHAGDKKIDTTQVKIGFQLNFTRIMHYKVPKYEYIQRDVRKELNKFYEGCEKINWAWVGEERMLAICTTDERRRDEEFWKFQAEKGDIWFMMFPGSDTNVLQELVWLICNDLNYETPQEVKLHDRYISYKFNANGKLMRENCFHTANYKFIEIMTPQRFIKTHIPLYLRNDLLNIGCKIVYVARNPREVLSTSYEFQKNCGDLKFTGSFSTYWNFLQNDLLLYCPYWSHVKSAWNFRNHPNLLFLYYDQLKTETFETIKKISTFFGKSLSHYDINKLIKHLKKSEFHETNNSNYLNSQIEAEMNNWIVENCQSTDLKFSTM